MTRRVHPRGTERFLRLVHDPDRRPWSIQTTAPLRHSHLRLNVDTARYIEWNVFFYGAYEPVVNEILTRAAEPGTIAVDVGANIGVHTLALSVAVGDGRVIAFEPNPIACDRLQRNLDLNRIANVTLHRVALGQEPGRATLHLGEGSLSDLIGTLVPGMDSSASMEVDVTTLDLVVDAAGGRVSVVKIDVEGFEAAVLRGGAAVLKRDRPVLLFEFGRGAWSRAGADLDAVLGELRSAGYTEFFEVGARALRPLSDPAPEYTLVLARPPRS